jgi:serine/threonine protein kinase
MTYCLNPHCTAPQNLSDDRCQSCGNHLILRDRYKALKPIGQGGFGRTFLAVDLAEILKPRCVIKQLYPQQKGDGIQSKAAELFRQEAQQLSTLGEHPSIPKFLNYFEEDGYQYLIQEFITGQSLAELLAEDRTLNASEVQSLLESMLETIAFLHQRNIIHRDIKPANIIETSEGKFVLVDFGAAKLATGTALGQTGTIIGSAEYVAPEQLRGKAVFASDLYSLGATCVTLLTGISPFSLFDTTTGRWEWRDYLSQPVDDRLGEVLDQMLLGPTKQRYSSVQDVYRGLESIQNSRSIDPLAQAAQTSVKEKALNLDINTTEPGALLNRGKRDILKNPNLLFPIIAGVILLWMSGTLISRGLRFNSPQNVITSRPSSLPAPTNFDPREGKPPVFSQPGGRIFDVITPVYSSPVKPFKVFQNQPSFETMALKDGGKTIAMGYLAGADKFELNLLNPESGAVIKQTLSEPNPKPDQTQIFKNSYRAQMFVNGGLFNIWFYADNASVNSQRDTLVVWDQASQKYRPSSDLPNAGKSLVPSADGKGFIVHGSKISSAWTFLPDGKLSQQNTMDSKLLSFSAQTCDTFGKDQVLRLSTHPLSYIHSFPTGPGTDPNTLQRDNRSSFVPLYAPLREAATYLLGRPATSYKLCELGESQDQKLLGFVDNYPASTTLDLESKYLPEAYQNAIKLGDKKFLEIGKHASKYGGLNSMVYVWDASKRQFMYVIPRYSRTMSMALSPDLKTMLLLEDQNNLTLTVWDLPTGELLREVPLGKTANRSGGTLAFMNDGKTVVLGLNNVDSKRVALPNRTAPDLSLWNIDELRQP